MIRTDPPLFPFQRSDISLFVEDLRVKRMTFCTWEQGLGKSRAVITVTDAMKFRMVLVICPAIARISWPIQVGEWGSPGDRHYIVDGVRAARKLRQQRSNGVLYVIVSSDGCRNDEVRHWLHQAPFDFAVIDEAQYLRNPEAKRTTALYHRGTGAIMRIPDIMLMTGTPIVSWPLDMWTHLKRFAPHRILNAWGQVMSFEEFKHEFHVLKWRRLPHAREPSLRIINSKSERDLQIRLDGFMHRRLKEEVLPDLPPFHVQRWPIACTVHEREGMLDALNREMPPDIVRMLREARTGEDMALVVDAINKDIGSTSKLIRILGMAKASAVGRMLAEELSENHYKIGILALNHDVMNMIYARLQAFNPVLITGRTKGAQDAISVRRFQTDPSCRVVVGQIQAIGTAIELTAASRLIGLQLLWLPGENGQAFARFHRIGQRDAVTCRVPYFPGTIDEAQMSVLIRRTSAALSVIDPYSRKASLPH